MKSHLLEFDLIEHQLHEAEAELVRCSLTSIPYMRSKPLLEPLLEPLLVLAGNGSWNGGF